MVATVVTLLMVAIQIMWPSILIGVELSCEMIEIADSERTMWHLTIASVTTPETKMRMVCFDAERIILKLKAAVP